MTRVRVQKIESTKDPEGNLGKRIELIEDRVIPRFAVRPATEEARMVQEVMKGLQQQLPMIAKQTNQFAIPKMILFLTETEYERNFIWKMNLKISMRNLNNKTNTIL
ncbi:MAG: arcadin 1 [Candidatus Bathyarchaeota archaeon]